MKSPLELQTSAQDLEAMAEAARNFATMRERYDREEIRRELAGVDYFEREEHPISGTGNSRRARSAGA